MRENQKASAEKHSLLATTSAALIGAFLVNSYYAERVTELSDKAAEIRRHSTHLVVERMSQEHRDPEAERKQDEVVQRLAKEAEDLYRESTVFHYLGRRKYYDLAKSIIDDVAQIAT